MGFDVALKKLAEMVFAQPGWDVDKFRDALVTEMEVHADAWEREYAPAACFLLGYRKASLTSFNERVRAYWQKQSNQGGATCSSNAIDCN